MEPFSVEHLEVERLLSEWRWLCPFRVTLVARTAFGDLFLRDEAGSIFWLNTGVGKLTKIAGSDVEFREMAETTEMRKVWFAELSVQDFAIRGLAPNDSQCIGFSTPLVFAETGHPNPPYVIDIYEHVSFLGDLNQQISELPDGAKVRLVLAPKPSSPQ